MANVLSAMASAVIKAAASVGIQTGVAAVQQAVLSAVASTALAMASSFLLKPNLDVKSQKQNIRQETAGRRRSYGRCGHSRLYRIYNQ